ncbi:type VII secretion protein EccE [Streptomyces sp. NBC_00483]|uniref:type VII secretion protein EccE n=1 Tax=Streptomyces sp. NBC_00483 TaxID=2975756 RepID=UPI002E17A930
MSSASRTRQRGNQGRPAPNGRRGGGRSGGRPTGRPGGQGGQGGRGSRTAQVAPPPQQQAAGPARPKLPRKIGSFGPISTHHLVIIEIALALVVAAAAIKAVLMLPAAVIGGLLVFLQLGRRRRHPLPEWMAIGRALKRRRRAFNGPPPADIDSGFAPLLEADPSLRTYEYEARDRRLVGFVGDGSFLTALVQVDSAPGPLRPQGDARPLPVELLAETLDVEDIHLESVQLVQYTQPAPAPHLPPQALAAQAYAALQAQAGTPAVRMTWVALKLDPELCPEAVEARGGDLRGAQRALLRAADQLISRLNGQGFVAEVLDENAVLSALSVATCVNPRANLNAQSQQGRSGPRTEESVRAWRCDDRWHASYWIGTWPQLGRGGTPLGALASGLSTTRTLATTFSVALARAGREDVAVSGHVRLSARSENELGQAKRELERAASGLKAGLVRLDREQLPGLLATLPLGGTR